MTSTLLRSLAKGIVWETISVVFVALVTYLVTGSYIDSWRIALIYGIIKIPIYFLHERMWKKIMWGKK